LILCLIGGGIVGRIMAPTGNTSLTHFDAIIVLGSPADRDGNPKPRQLANVTEAVREYERGIAPRLILTGGAVANQFGEARLMAKTAQAEGIPPSAIFVEPQARDTVQNACYAVRIMNARGWRSAEVISSASHLPRAGLIFSLLPIEWRVHAAAPLEPDAFAWGSTAVEVAKTARYLTWSRWTESCPAE
jgi:uncharacterized SAM-binding protein YcdF (DUF218 family)